ncbi:MAG: trypsin-like peptidase domain-containing protein [Saprospiraceae bacterium]|nr:trypsin-like peptidase domain-containing protein [Saprospiraceae bacterium]
MKNVLYLTLSGLVGGVMAFFLLQTQLPEIQPLEQQQYQAKNVSTTNPNFPFDFVSAADRATKAVVHIEAAESESLARERLQEQNRKNPFYNSPFRDFFDQNDMFFSFPFGGQYFPKKGSGSGVIISEDGYILTNNHVVGFADDIVVTLNDERKLKGKVIGTDPGSDLAVVKIEATDLPTLQYADSDKAKVGEWVLAVGNPFNYLTSTVTAGIISAKNRDIDVIRDKNSIEEFIQTDAAINPGNSGGALVNAKGELLGINTAIATKTGYYNGYSFAIPINLASEIADNIIKYGTFERGNLGVYIHDIDEDYKSTLSLNFDNGVVVTELVDGGAAQYAGVLPNDVITEVNGEAVKDSEELANRVRRSKVGETLNLTIIREGREKKIPVRLKKRL